jgi:hypothetical protein
MKGLSEHITREKSAKMVCVSHVLATLGIPTSAYQSTWTRKTGNGAALGVMRRNGYAVRSRRSSLPKGISVGAARARIARLRDPEGSCYVIGVDGHLLLLNASGDTICDTAPRKRDGRKILTIYAVWKKG